MPYDLLEIGRTPAVIRRTLPDLSGEAIRETAGTPTGGAAWIVPPETGEGLTRLTGVVEDRGVKRPAIELARTLLKGDGSAIPLIRGGYASVGKLLGSVKTLLEKVAGGPRRLFIIVVSDDLFAQLLKTAQVSASVPEPNPEPTLVFRGRSGAVLNLLERVPEPAALQAAFIGRSADAVAVRQLILRAARVDDTVLISGDTGTGKEIVARQIHAHSPRRDKPLRAVNCGAFPPDLLESELFGHVRGAFSGALTTTEGLWVSADRGTLFLDEIGDLSPSHQVKLLRALQEGRIRKVGGDAEIAVDARVICATNRDLFAMVQAGQFREDLYYRLRGFLVTTMPLREHPEDVPLLAATFWRRIARDEEAVLPDDLLEMLCDYPWPGNVRDLKTVLGLLFSLFGQVQPLELRHLQAVFEMHAMRWDGAAPSGPAVASRQEKLTAFRHLRRVYETVRAVEHRLAPLLNGEGVSLPATPGISTEVANLLSELELHGRIPRLFTAGTFETISLLCSRLAYFLSAYEAAPDAAVASLRAGTRHVIEDATGAVLGEIERVLAAAL